MTSQGGGPQRRSVNVQVLPSASNIVITGGSFTGVQQNYTGKKIPGQMSALGEYMLTRLTNPHFEDSSERLYARVAPNAILNAGGRADEVRCYPGTREEVIGIIEEWIDGDGDLSRGIFWLSGPAGAGKSAIIQTIAERCIQRNIPMANYFFFRADTSRNHAGSVVATLLYQLLDLYPALKTNILALLDTKPLVFDQSIRDQFKYLVDNPVRVILDGPAHISRLVLLIDGLDECSQEAKHVQRDLLQVLHHLSSQQGSPFVVLVASRAEPHLVMAFSEIGSSNDSIFLDDNYRPSDDIRLFVAAEFDKIRRTHHLGQNLDADWPPKASIDEIVQKSSGQFIYAATIMRFISGSSASPAHSLEKVRGIRLVVKNFPFSELDAIYTHILSQAEDWDSAKDIMASQLLLPKVAASRTYRMPRDHGRNIRKLLSPLQLTQSDIESFLSDLVAVMQYNRETDEVIFYHASLQDFLCDESRSKGLYIDLELFTTKLAVAHISAMSTFYEVALFCNIFDSVKISTPLLRDTLVSWNPLEPGALHSSDFAPYMSGLQFSACQSITTFHRLYYDDDNLFYQAMLRKWITWFDDLEIPHHDLIPASGQFPQATKILRDIQKSRTAEKALPMVAPWKRALSKIWPITK